MKFDYLLEVGRRIGVYKYSPACELYELLRRCVNVLLLSLTLCVILWLGYV